MNSRKKILNTFIFSLLTALFSLHAFHYSKADKCEVAARGNLEDIGAASVGHN